MNPFLDYFNNTENKNYLKNIYYHKNQMCGDCINNPD